MTGSSTNVSSISNGSVLSAIIEEGGLAPEKKLENWEAEDGGSGSARGVVGGELGGDGTVVRDPSMGIFRRSRNRFTVNVRVSATRVVQMSTHFSEPGPSTSVAGEDAAWT